MEYLLKALPIAIPVILVILIFLMGYVKARPMWPTSSPVCASTPRC